MTRLPALQREHFDQTPLPFGLTPCMPSTVDTRGEVTLPLASPSPKLRPPLASPSPCVPSRSSWTTLSPLPSPTPSLSPSPLVLSLSPPFFSLLASYETLASAEFASSASLAALARARARPGSTSPTSGPLSPKGFVRPDPASLLPQTQSQPDGSDGLGRGAGGGEPARDMSTATFWVALTEGEGAAPASGEQLHADLGISDPEQRAAAATVRGLIRLRERTPQGDMLAALF